MDSLVPLKSSSTVSSKKLPFTSAERELVMTLVRKWPVIEDKRTNARNVMLKKKAWEDLTAIYNSQPYVSKRVSYQLKRCWENMKTLRKKELCQTLKSTKRTGTKKFLNETDPGLGCSTTNTQPDQELHELKVEREKILIERENNLLEYEKKFHDLQIQKVQLEIELLKKQIGN